MDLEQKPKDKHHRILSVRKHKQYGKIHARFGRHIGPSWSGSGAEVRGGMVGFTCTLL